MMSVSSENATQPCQPYQCLLCGNRFTRSENLKRHSMLHNRKREDASIPCEICPARFSRHDLRHRHMKRKHQTDDHDEQINTTKKPSFADRMTGQSTNEGFDPVPISPAPSRHGSMQQSPSSGRMDVQNLWTEPSTQSQSDARMRRLPSSESRLCRAVTDRVVDQDGNYGAGRLQGPSISSITGASDVQQMASSSTIFPSNGSVGCGFTPKTGSHSGWPHEHTSQSVVNSTALSKWPSNHTSPTVEDWYPSPSQTACGFELFFAHASHFLPFLHEPSFDFNQVQDYLALSMLSLGFQYGEDPDCDEQEGSGADLSARCFQQGRHRISREEEATEDPASSIVRVQSYLMLEICALLYLCGKDSAHGLRIHSRMITFARSAGLMQPRNDTPRTNDLDSLWLQFIEAESQKRTALAVHQIDALWYQFFSIPRSLSHLEVKHDLPYPEDCWSASSASEWAHWQLVNKSTSSSVQYVDAVRHFLSADATSSPLPAFSPYGAVNISQFLISSAREVSGWSSITGRISMERLELVKMALLALESVVRPQTSLTASAITTMCEATWEKAMIELLIWSPSHTGGTVADSIDAVMKQLLDVTPSCDFLLETNTAHTIQPHVDWFLRYLNNTTNVDSEPPWVTIFAYKAFLIAWQLVRGRVSGVMSAIGVEDGDTHALVSWGQKVFGRRKRWKVGGLIMSSLEMIATI